MENWFVRRLSLYRSTYINCYSATFIRQNRKKSNICCNSWSISLDIALVHTVKYTLWSLHMHVFARTNCSWACNYWTKLHFRTQFNQISRIDYLLSTHSWDRRHHWTHCLVSICRSIMVLDIAPVPYPSNSYVPLFLDIRARVFKMAIYLARVWQFKKIISLYSQS